MKRAAAFVMAMVLGAALTVSASACKWDFWNQSEPAASTVEEEQLEGGWTRSADLKLTEDAKKAFDKAMDGLTGVNYVPIGLLATQTVAGTNYRILCEATVVYPGAEMYYSIVTVYEDLEGNASILSIANMETETAQ